MTITSPHNERSRRSASLRAASGATSCGVRRPRARTCSRRPSAAGWQPEAVSSPTAAAWTACRWRRTCWRRSRSSAPAPARSASTAMRWAPAPVGPGAASRCGASATPATSAPSLRSALAFGAGSVALGPGSADPYGHKAVRASMGALFDVPVARVREPSRSCPAARSRSSRGEGVPLDEIDAAGDITLRRRRGARGAPAARHRRPATRSRTSRSASESLNAAMAATVALYESTVGCAADA